MTVVHASQFIVRSACVQRAFIVHSSCVCSWCALAHIRVRSGVTLIVLVCILCFVTPAGSAVDADSALWADCPCLILTCRLHYPAQSYTTSSPHAFTTLHSHTPRQAHMPSFIVLSVHSRVLSTHASFHCAVHSLMPRRARTPSIVALLT